MSAHGQRRLLSKLTKFVAKRAASGMQSNLQFWIDLQACGLETENLGEVQRLSWDGFPFYRWPLPGLDGYALAEFGGRLFLLPEYLPLPECVKPVGDETQPHDAEEVRS